VAVTVDEFLGAAQRMPFRPLREALEDRPFIVLAPHPDDESLGCIRTAKLIRRTG
jgi:LmbE family N-acetylglucosaminyl deacetylase